VEVVLGCWQGVGQEKEEEGRQEKEEVILFFNRFLIK